MIVAQLIDLSTICQFLHQLIHQPPRHRLVSGDNIKKPRDQEKEFVLVKKGHFERNIKTDDKEELTYLSLFEPLAPNTKRKVGGRGVER